MINGIADGIECGHESAVEAVVFEGQLSAARIVQDIRQTLHCSSVSGDRRSASVGWQPPIRRDRHSSTAPNLNGQTHSTRSDIPGLDKPVLSQLMLYAKTPGISLG